MARLLIYGRKSLELLPGFKVTWDYSEVRCGISPEENLQSV